MEAAHWVSCTKRNVKNNTHKKKEKWKVGARRHGESYCNLCASWRPTYVDV